MLVPNAELPERTGSQLLGARLRRLLPKSANTYHKHIKAGEPCFVLKGNGRIPVGARAPHTARRTTPARK